MFGFLAQIQFLSKFSIELRSGRWEQKLNVSLNVYPCQTQFACVFGFIVQLEKLCMSLNRCCWSEIKLKILVVFLLHYSIHVPPSDLTLIMIMFLGLKALPLLFQGYLLSLLPNSFFVLSDHKTFLQKAFGLSVCAAANFSWPWRCWFWNRGFFLGPYTLSPWLSKLPSLWTLMFQLFPVHSRLYWIIYTYIQLFKWMILAPRDLPNMCKYIILSLYVFKLFTGFLGLFHCSNYRSAWWVLSNKSWQRETTSRSQSWSLMWS